MRLQRVSRHCPPNKSQWNIDEKKWPSLWKNPCGRLSAEVSAAARVVLGIVGGVGATLSSSDCLA